MRTLIVEVLARGGLADPTSWAPFVDLAVASGPTADRGPLRHDLLLAPAVGPPRTALNVFGVSSDLPIAAVAERWAADRLGVAAARAVGALARALPGGATLSGGPFRDASGERLKLYLSPSAGASSGERGLLAAAAGLSEIPVQASSFGVDVTGDGLSRPRAYVRVRDDGPGASHGLESVVGGAGPGAGKRTRVRVFAPGAVLSDLRTAEEGMAGGPAVHVDSPWLDALRDRAQRAGLVVRPVAFERDVYPDGRTAFDAFVTLGVPERPTPGRPVG